MKKSKRTRELRAFLKNTEHHEIQNEIDSFIRRIDPKHGHALDQLIDFSTYLIMIHPEHCSIAVDLVDQFRHHSSLLRSEACLDMINKSRPDLKPSLERYMYGCESDDIEKFMRFQKVSCIAIEKDIAQRKSKALSLRLKDPEGAESEILMLNQESIQCIDRKESYSTTAKSFNRWNKNNMKSSKDRSPSITPG